MGRPVIGLVLALAWGVPAPADDLSTAWLRDGRVETRGAARDTVPLGSLWKLFVYAYAVDRGMETPDYRCGVPRRKGEEFCCEAGQSVSRDTALARSCGAFFAPDRLGIDETSWRAYWQGRTPASATWLGELRHMRGETIASPASILHAVAAIPSAPRTAAARALLPVVVETAGAATHLGGTLRAKTFTWPHPQRPGKMLGGGAGWLVDGTPVWFAATGGSRLVLGREAERLSVWWPAPTAAVLAEDACVAVDYFERYPVRAVDHLPSKAAAVPGPLHGSFRVLFANGNAVTFSSRGEMRLERSGARLVLRGRLPLHEYVARVLDREADPTATAAARALSVVARSWLVQNAPWEAGCYRVDDSTRAQRVSPSPASAGARGAALFTDGLLVRGEAVRYRLAGEEPGVLGWMEAARAGEAGRTWDAILTRTFPRGSLAASGGETECRRLAEAETWLVRASQRWQRRLAGEPGYEAPEAPLTVCALDYGAPYADRQRLRVHVRGLHSAEDRLTLAHEYVHLAFRFHPRGGDEAYVEQLARLLANEGS